MHYKYEMSSAIVLKKCIINSTLCLVWLYGIWQARDDGICSKRVEDKFGRQTYLKRMKTALIDSASTLSTLRPLRCVCKRK